MIVTQYAKVPVGSHTTIDKFPMYGYNLNELPMGLMASNLLEYIDDTIPQRIWRLSSVDPDGRTAYFSPVGTFNNPVERTLQYLFIPENPPRTLFTDYTYSPE